MRTHIIARNCLFIGIISIVISPFIFTFPTFWSRLDFSNTSSIGDTIGGITSPIVGLLGAILVFYALIEQVKANNIVQNQIEEQKNKENLQSESSQVTQLYDNLKSGIDNFRYVSLEPHAFGQGQYLHGSEAIYKMLTDFYCDCHIDKDELEGNPKITELNSILQLCDVILDKLSNSNISDKEVFNLLTKHQFRYRVYPKLRNITSLNEYHCESCDKNHGLPNETVVLIERLIERTK